MRVHLLRAREDDGAVAILVALLFTLFLVLAAFALDIGNAYQKVRQQSVAADAAALAAAAQVGEAIPRSARTCQEGLAAIDYQTIAQDTADDFNRRNSKSGSEPRTTVTVTCEDGGKAVQVRVQNSHSVPTSLGSLVGVSQIESGSYAVARYVRVSPTSDLRPWAVCNDTVTAAQLAPTTTFWTAIDSMPVPGVGSCQSSGNGNWGAIDFDGGNNSATDLANWTANGYPGAVTIPGQLAADPGFSNTAALRQAFSQLVGQLALFPSVSGRNNAGGGNVRFAATGVAVLQVCGVVYGNNTYNIDATTGRTSACWTTPRQGTPTPQTPTVVNVTGTTTTVGNGNNRVTTLVVTAAGTFDCSLPPSQIQVVVPGASRRGNTPSDLTTTVATCLDSRTVTLTNAATQDVVAKPNVKVTTTRYTYSGGFGPYDVRGNLLNHIQFRWVDYTTSYTGTGASTCALSDPACIGAAELWR